MDSGNPESHEYVYLLVESSNLRFKIGKACNIHYRARSLKKDFNLEKSRCLRCKEGDGLVVEKILHRVFRHSQDIQPHGDGRMEWYKIECYDQLQEFVRAHQSLLDYIAFEAIPEKTKNVYQKTPSLTDEEKAMRFSEDEQLNLKQVEPLKAWIKNLEKHNAIVGIAYHNQYPYLILKGDNDLLRHILDNWYFCDWRGRGSVNITSGIRHNQTLGTCFVGLHVLLLVQREGDWMAEMESVKQLAALFDDIPRLKNMEDLKNVFF